MSRAIEIGELRKHFPVSKGWELVEVGRESVPSKPTVSGTPIRCIDRDFGYTKKGYNPDSVPPAPAWLGAVDGVASFMKGDTLEERMEEASRRTESVGFKPAIHGDYAREDDGCAYRRALMERAFDGLPEITKEEHRILTTKTGIHYVKLRRPDDKKDPEGFIINETEGTTILPDGGRFYPADLWFARKVGIQDEQLFPVLAKCGELLLPKDHKVLFVVRD